MTDDEAWRAVGDGVVARCGGLDILVNNAGVVVVASIESIALEDWRRVQRVNVDGTFLGCGHGVRVMKARGGAILNMSSVSGIVGGHNLVAYNAAKGAVRFLTKSVALHCARQGYGVRCNSIHPGFVETRMLEDIAAGAGGRDPEALREKLRAGVPLGRNAEPDEVAALAAYLASDEAAFATGAESSSTAARRRCEPRPDPPAILLRGFLGRAAAGQSEAERDLAEVRGLAAFDGVGQDGLQRAVALGQDRRTDWGSAAPACVSRASTRSTHRSIACRPPAACAVVGVIAASAAMPAAETVTIAIAAYRPCA